jgi:chromosome segregation ATPase
MSEYSDEDYTLTETQCEERCDELRSQLDEANKIIESLGQESDHFCKQADELLGQVARLEGELAQARLDTERVIVAAIDLIDSSQDARCADLRIVIQRMREAIDAARSTPETGTASAEMRDKAPPEPA